MSDKKPFITTVKVGPDLIANWLWICRIYGYINKKYV